MGKLKVGVVGAGNIAQSAHLPVYQNIADLAEVVAIADLNLPRAQAAAEKFHIPAAYSSVEELLKKADVDYIDVCVWNGYHADVTVAAADAGKHVLCEKPMAFNVEHALRMKEAIERNHVQFMLAVPSRYRPDVRLLREMVDAGKMGEVYYAKTASIRRRGTPIGWFTDLKKAGGGPVIDIGVHCIDRTWFLMGCPRPTRLSASTSYAIGDFKTKGVSRWTALDSDVTAFDTEDSAAGVIHFENGACMLFEVSWALNAKPTEYTQICGSKAGATLEPFTIYGEDMDYLTDNTPTVPQNVNPFEVEIRHFIDCVNTGKSPDSPLEHALTMQKILNGIYDSAKLGKEIEL